MTLPLESLEPDRTVIAGRYDVLRPIGAGSFGNTHLARDRTLDRLVAVKVLDERTGADWKAIELFKREGEVLRGLRHHGIPAVYDIFRAPWHEGAADFLVMEFIDGVSLQHLIDERTPVDSAEVVHLFTELLGILDYLHRRVPPILHRDIKPANIVVRHDGEPTLVDFGSVRRETLGPDESGSTVAGTFGYMPYEQYMGQAGPSSDLYALGATFLHLMTGRPPRAWMSEDGVITVPSNLGGDSRLGAVLIRMLQRSPTARFPSAHAVREAMWQEFPVPGVNPGGALTTPRGVAVDLAVLGPAPRLIEGPVAELLERTAPSPWQLADSSEKVTDGPSGLDLAWTVFFAVISFGIIPMIFISLARQRRRRLEKFLRSGVPGNAEIVSIQPQPTHLGEKLARVGYQFDVDGERHRDSDVVLPVTAARWLVGDTVQILFIPEQDFDSVIISTR